MATQGKIALVTGSAAGIGRHIALRFAREGCRVILADFQSVDESLREIKAIDGEADHVQCDITSEESVRAAVAKVEELARGPIDFLVNNAGINGNAQLVKDMPLDSWNRTIATNLTGTMLVTREVIPVMTANSGGRIVNVASNVARRGLPFRADYVCSKWAVLGLTQTLALELAADNIRVNAVCPGPVEGNRIEQVMQAHADAEGKTLAEVREEWQAPAALKRFIDPDEVAAVAWFLCSDESSAMTGQALNVTAGHIMT